MYDGQWGRLVGRYNEGTVVEWVGEWVKGWMVRVDGIKEEKWYY